jgi:hypothetical protein
MAQYKNFIDEFLTDYMPDYEEVGLAGAGSPAKSSLTARTSTLTRTSSKVCPTASTPSYPLAARA